MALYNVKKEFQELSADELKIEYDKIASPVAVGCLNLSGDINIGMMLRTSSLFGVGKFYILGRKRYDRRSSVGTQHHIPVELIRAVKGRDNELLDEEAIFQILLELQESYTIVLVEQTPQSIRPSQLKRIEMSKPPLFLFGNEAEGIPKRVLEMANIICVEIPQRGIGRSLNVSTACGIILYEWFRDPV